jgi:hypothetical protein
MTPLKLLLGAALGAALGYGWYRVVGCSTGACPITARWWTSALYGAVVGGAMAWNGV